MKKYHRSLTLAGIICGAAISMSGCSDEPEYRALPAGSTVIALGDSLTYGYGVSTDTAYPTVLAELSAWNIINAGVNGDTSADVLQRIQSDMTRANITAVVNELKSANIDVVLIAQPHFSASALFGKASDNPFFETNGSTISYKIPLMNKHNKK